MNKFTFLHKHPHLKQNLYFIVSFGGLVGLLYGISLLSAFEFMEKFVLKLKATITRLLCKPNPGLDEPITAQLTTQRKPMQQTLLVTKLDNSPL